LRDRDIVHCRLAVRLDLYWFKYYYAVPD